MNFSDLVKAIEETAEVGVWRGGGGYGEEAIENLEYFSIPLDSHKGTDASELISAVNGTVQAWLLDASSDGSDRPGVVFGWYDWQAQQLRM